MTSKKYIEHNKSFYLERLKQSNTGYLAVGWGSEKSQFKRFDVLSNISDTLLSSSILDVGCGVGDFWNYLSQQGYKGNYCGIDILEDMVLEAKKKYDGTDFRTHSIDEIPSASFDYVVMSGIFTFANTQMLREMVTSAFRVSNKGIAFNALSSKASSKETGEYYAAPSEVLNFALDLSPKSTLKHDYLPHDFTVYIYK